MIVKNQQDMSYVRHNFAPVKKKLLNKFSNAEEHFENLIRETDMFYVREKGNYQYNTRWCYYDFYIPFYRLYIEIDGKSHDSIDQQRIDREKHEIIDWKKRFLVRLKNEEVLNLEKLTLGYLVEHLCEQSCSPGNLFSDFTVSDYLENLTKNVHQGIRDMLSDTGIIVDKDKDVFMFHKNTGKIYRFKNECIAKLNLPQGLSAVRKLIVNTDYSKKTVRKIVLAYSEEECISRVKSSIGMELKYNGNIKYSCLLTDLIPIMSESEKEKWLGIPSLTKEKLLSAFKQLGFSIKEERKKNRIKISCDNYICHAKTHDYSVMIRAFLIRDELNFKIVHPRDWFGKRVKIDAISNEPEELSSFIEMTIDSICKKYNLKYKEYVK